jgi:hypothetical protein
MDGSLKPKRGALASLGSAAERIGLCREGIAMNLRAFAILMAGLAPAAGGMEAVRATPIQGSAPATVQDAERFIDALYARYRGHPIEGRRRPWAGPVWWNESVYTAWMVAQSERLRQLSYASRTQLPDVVQDAICQCADWGEIVLVERTFGTAGMAHLEAQVRFRNDGVERVVRLLLQRTRAGWRVGNVFSDDLPQGLAEYYRFHIARLEREQGEDSSR